MHRATLQAFSHGPRAGAAAGQQECWQPIKLFHGEEDRNAPIALVRRVIQGLPSAELITYPGEAHLSTLCNRFADVGCAISA